MSASSIEELKRKLEEKKRQVRQNAAGVLGAAEMVDPATSSLAEPPKHVEATSANVSTAAPPTSPPPPPPNITPLAASTAMPSGHVAPPGAFSSPETSRLSYHSELTVAPPTTSSSFVTTWIASSGAQLHQTAKRLLEKQEEVERNNDISISRKRARKEDSSSSQPFSSSHHPRGGTTACVGSGSGGDGSSRSSPAGFMHYNSISSPCQSVDLYENKGRLSEGVYGVVFKAIKAARRDNAAGGASAGGSSPTASSSTRSRTEYFALKQIKGQWLAESQVGFPPYLLRELELTMRLRHPNIVKTLEVVLRSNKEQQPSGDSHGTPVGAPSSGPSSTTASPPPPPVPTLVDSAGCSVYAVMEYAWRDLKSYLYETKTPFVHLSKRNHHPDAPSVYIARCKCIAKQLFEGLAFLHKHRVLHRDLKTSNILVASDGTAQIADFGLSRFIRRREHLTPTVVTLMYRAPELHFGITDYDYALDVWSAGCILAELFLKYPLFRGETDSEHCARVCHVLGYPTDDSFEGIFHKREAVATLTQCLGTVPFETPQQSCNVGGVGGGGNARLRQFLNQNPETSYRGASVIPASGVDLLCLIFQWNPRLRPSAEDVLRHPFFTEDAPLPADKGELFKPMPFALSVGSSVKAPSPSATAVAVDGSIAPDATIRVVGLSGPNDNEDDDAHLLEQARLEDEEEQEAQALNVRGTSPEAAARKRMLAVDDEANSRIPTPVLVPAEEPVETVA